MIDRKTNIHNAQYDEQFSERDNATWRSLDLSGEHLGVRIEELAVGGTSSYHHYHTAEEEHVLVLEGTATLTLGNDKVAVGAGDHVWFPAGEELPHHIKNTSSEAFKFLVFGERKQNDVVFYPDGSVVMVKSVSGVRQYDYKPRSS